MGEAPRRYDWDVSRNRMKHYLEVVRGKTCKISLVETRGRGTQQHKPTLATSARVATNLMFREINSRFKVLSKWLNLIAIKNIELADYLHNASRILSLFLKKD